MNEPRTPQEKLAKELDLGDNHWLGWYVGAEGQRIGAIIWHLNAQTGEVEAGGVFWAGDYAGPRWDLEGEADERLTLSPSILCNCGDHGYIRAGKWVKA